MRDLKIVVIVVTGIDTLITFVIGNGIKHFRICQTVVISVCDLSVEPEIGLFALTQIFEPSEEVYVNNVGSVKAQAVNAELVDPEFRRAEKVVDNILVLQIQLHQIIVTCPALVPERITIGALSVKVQILEPAAVGGIPLFLLHILEREEISSDMIEHTVQNDTDAVFTECFTDFLKRSVVTKATVDLTVIDRVVSVAGAFKERVENYRVNAQLFEMVDTVIYFVQSVVQLTVILPWCSAKAERVDVIDNTFINVAHIHGPFSHFKPKSIITQKNLLCKLKNCDKIYHVVKKLYLEDKMNKIPENKTRKRLRLVLCTLYLFEIVMCTFPFYQYIDGDKLYSYSVVEMLSALGTGNTTGMAEADFSAASMFLPVNFIFAIIPIVGFFFCALDKESNVKNLVSILCCLLGVLSILTVVTVNFLSLGSLIALLLYILISFLSAFSILARVAQSPSDEKRNQ